MAAKRIREACSSTSSTPALKKIREDCCNSSLTRQWIHDLFLNFSFRGEDNLKNFTENLYTALVQKGINTIRDGDQPNRGEDMSSQLLRAIELSRISIIVFSSNYASSTWCLDKLVKILQCKKMMLQTVLPVFYNVDPSDVRKQSGSFAEAFASHEERFKEEMQKVKNWRAALSEAGNLSGWHLQNVSNGHESEIIQRITEEVFIKLKQTPLNVSVYQVGIDSRVHDINILLNVVGSDDICIVGIHGMGGIGKTTIAKAVYNLIFRKFDGSSFLMNVGEISKQHNGLLLLRKQLLSDVLTLEEVTTSNNDRGLNVIKQRLHDKSVLIVLDDVDHLDQLNALVGNRDWFGLGSKIIITTRDVDLLNVSKMDATYMVEALDHYESLQLFSWHAFRKNHPTEDFVELSNAIVSCVGGLPLALEVLGSFLFDKRKIPEWKSELEKLKRIPNDRILNKLKISYDALDHNQKVVFLDIAFFLSGMEIDYAIKILHACGLFPETEIRVLVHRSLVTIIGDKLRMHDLLRDMGREIVWQESPKEPGERSRLWFYEDVHDVLTKNTGTKAVEGLILTLPILEGLKTKGLASMENLRLLQVKYVQLTGGYEHRLKEFFPFLGEQHLFKNLRWLCWHGFNLKYIPTNFHLENLVILDMQDSHIKQVWKGIKFLEKLTVLNLSNSRLLTRTPNFLGLPNLERLMLGGCTSLVEVHESIRHLEKLVFLNLKDCKNLYNLPSNIYELKSLKDLILSGCSKLDELPEGLGNMESLKELLADGTAIKQLPNSIVHLKNLESLSLSGSKGSPSNSMIPFLWSMGLLRKSPDSINPLLASFSGLCSLKRLFLKDCNLSEGAIPSDLGSLSSLEELNLENNNFISLPSSINCLSRLWFLNLRNCAKLQSLPKLPSRIKGLNADDCISLERLSNLSNVKGLKTITLQNCSKLIEIQGLEGFESIPTIHVERFLQGMLERGDFNIVLPWSEIPEWFRYQSLGSSMSFKLRPRMGYEIQGFIICAVYAADKESIKAMAHPKIDVMIKVKVQGIKKAKWNEGIRLDLVNHKDNIYVKYIKLNSLDLFEGGNQVDVSISTNDKIQVKKCGMDVLYVSRENASTVKFLSNALEL